MQKLQVRHASRRVQLFPETRAVARAAANDIIEPSVFYPYIMVKISK
jgi:hypothetical protein